jgi:selenocysteine lyase/cysteine desulfurase
LGVVSFHLEGVHYNLVVKLLNDRFGIQVRGGCACAGTYGHFLFYIRKSLSSTITDRINQGDLSTKPGWVRFSIHPTMTDTEADYVCHAISEVARHHKEWARDYRYDPHANEFLPLETNPATDAIVRKWFQV